MTPTDADQPGMTEKMRCILADHARRYPGWAVDDLYKLLHQAAMGSEHAAGEETSARKWLLRELAELGPGPDEPLVDPVSPDGRLVRVHLRPYAARRLSPEPLLQAFLQTAERFAPSVERLLVYCGAALSLAGEGILRIPREQIVERLAVMRASGYPPVHHSAAFVQLYRPAYRVVSVGLLPREIAIAAHTDGAQRSAEIEAE